MKRLKNGDLVDPACIAVVQFRSPQFGLLWYVELSGAEICLCESCMIATQLAPGEIVRVPYRSALPNAGSFELYLIENRCGQEKSKEIQNQRRHPRPYNHAA